MPRASILILGDFDASNPLWGGDVLDNEGKIIDNIIDNDNIALYFNDGIVTFHNIYQNQFSAINLSLRSLSINLDFNWCVDDYLNGSDQYPLHLEFPRNSPHDAPPKWQIGQNLAKTSFLIKVLIPSITILVLMSVLQKKICLVLMNSFLCLRVSHIDV